MVKQVKEAVIKTILIKMWASGRETRRAHSASVRKPLTVHKSKHGEEGRGFWARRRSYMMMASWLLVEWLRQTNSDFSWRPSGNEFSHFSFSPSQSPASFELTWPKARVQQANYHHTQIFASPDAEWMDDFTIYWENKGDLKAFLNLHVLIL